MNKVFDDYLVGEIRFTDGLWTATEGKYQPQVLDTVFTLGKINGRTVTGEVTEMTSEYITVNGVELLVKDLCFIGKM